MSVPPSMVHRSSGNTPVSVRSAASGDALYGTPAAAAGQGQLDEDASADENKDLPDCKVKRNYTCAGCDFFTQNPRVYLYHLRDVHKEKVKIHECPSCLYASKHYQKLVRHKKMVHGDEPADPSADASRKRKHKVAVEELPEPPPFDAAEDADEAPDDVAKTTFHKCSVCNYTCQSQNQLTKHEREEHIETKFFRCTKCSYVTHIKARFTKHVKYHSMPMIKCEMCDFRTPYKWNLDRHCKNHNGKGAFRCSACNFTADIKQSLTVHEMNHHVPPVGQAAGLGVGRRRNKVGASDTTAAEEASAEANHLPSQCHTENDSPAASDVEKNDVKILTKEKKQKTCHITAKSTDPSSLSDFINPEDIIHHANGKVYIKNKCKLCNFKSAWDGEMAKHHKKVHGFDQGETIGRSVKKTPRPVPNLIPIPSPTSLLKNSQSHALYPILKAAEIPQPSEPIMSQKDINDICAKSANSALKDLASLFDSEDVFKYEPPSKIPNLIPASIFSATKTMSKTDEFKRKNASFFDKLKEKLELGTTSNLTCRNCGYESKCLTEQVKHQKMCGKETAKVQHIIPLHNFSSSRCQYCRQRCKSSTDLFNHMQTCLEAQKAFNQELRDADTLSEPELKIDDNASSEEVETKPHPMENKVFVWNDIMVPMDIEVDDSNYEYTEDKIDDNVSLDLSVRTQSPTCSENSYLGHETNNNYVPRNNQVNVTTTTAPVNEKIPTHGNDISVAQHKRVFKCPHCTFWASTASRFHVHIVGHLNKKPFECSLCSYRSNWRWDITKHIKLKSVRDPAHESAKVLMTDETGRRNYTKYNKYLTEIPVSSLRSSETSGGSGTRPKNHDKPLSSGKLEKTKFPTSGDLGPHTKNSTRPPPPLKVADSQYFSKIGQEKKRSTGENKRTLFKCKKCDFRDDSRETLLEHVKGHYLDQHAAQQLQQQQQQQQHGRLERHARLNPELTVVPVLPSTSGLALAAAAFGGSNGAVSSQDLSLRGTSPDRDDERHCRLKHKGNIRVVSNKNGQERIEIEEQLDGPECSIAKQDCKYKCSVCPFSTNAPTTFEYHQKTHPPLSENQVHQVKEELLEDYQPQSMLQSATTNNAHTESDSKRVRCTICPYATKSKAQYTYHKQFHKPKNGQYTCPHCSYNVSKRHLLHQHLKVHDTSSTKQDGESSEYEEISNAMVEGVPPESEIFQFSDVPLVWVAKSDKFTKMFKCRFCPHLNSRKVNIQEHEKMHGTREKVSDNVGCNEMEHHCTECNYVCNNAGVLSSHSKVHQGLSGVICRLVDPAKTDEEQIDEISKMMEFAKQNCETVSDDRVISDSLDNVLYFCSECPARFLKENEFVIHKQIHNSHLLFSCEYCSYSSKERSFIMSHYNVHTFEYQERTKVLKSMYPVSKSSLEPEIVSEVDSVGETYWVVKKSSSGEVNSNGECSETAELDQHKPQDSDSSKSPNEHSRELLEAYLQGNPDFTYQTYLKNGRVKEKRYKCHKCPSAFEKREQYKIHLGLHGSKQKYKCETCDYSVKYYANYAQHIKKHKYSDDANAAKNSLDEVRNNTGQEVTGYSGAQSTIECDENDSLNLSVADQQILSIMHQRNAELTKCKPTNDDQKVFWCPYCPYTNGRKDAVENHKKRHVEVSGMKNVYTCNHCDYSVPQAHFLREHSKLHFIPNKLNQVDGYVTCDNLKLITSVEASTVNDNIKEEINFEEQTDDKQYLPNLGESVLEKFNNNEGEKQFIDVKLGKQVVKPEPTSAALNDVAANDNKKLEMN